MTCSLVRQDTRNHGLFRGVLTDCQQFVYEHHELKTCDSMTRYPIWGRTRMQYPGKRISWIVLIHDRIIALIVRMKGKKDESRKKKRIMVGLNHLSWTNRESNPGPLPEGHLLKENMLREYYTTKPFARNDLWLVESDATIPKHVDRLPVERRYSQRFYYWLSLAGATNRTQSDVSHTNFVTVRWPLWGAVGEQEKTDSKTPGRFRVSSPESIWPI